MPMLLFKLKILLLSDSIVICFSFSPVTNMDLEQLAPQSHAFPKPRITFIFLLVTALMLWNSNGTITIDDELMMNW